MSTHQITFLPYNISTIAPAGSTLIQAALDAGVHINASCGGEGVCGKCRVRVEAGSVADGVSEQLNQEDIQKGYRLACRSIVTGDLTVRIPVVTREGGSERVEYAIRLPGSDADREDVVWLPIDAKFPQEDYQRLLDAQEAADKEQSLRSLRQLEARVKAEARAIREKYIDPPHTTDFAILFLPVEGLYAEVLRIPGLCDCLQREHRVVVAGPTTLAALLNSLQMGFRTLAIGRRSSQVWELLGVVKTEFGKFGDTLSKTKKKLQEAANTIDHAEVRSRAIERTLRRVEEAPPDKQLAVGLDESHVG